MVWWVTEHMVVLMELRLDKLFKLIESNQHFQVSTNPFSKLSNLFQMILRFDDSVLRLD